MYVPNSIPFKTLWSEIIEFCPKFEKRKAIISDYIINVLSLYRYGAGHSLEEKQSIIRNGEKYLGFLIPKI